MPKPGPRIYVGTDAAGSPPFENDWLNAASFDPWQVVADTGLCRPTTILMPPDLPQPPRVTVVVSV